LWVWGRGGRRPRSRFDCGPKSASSLSQNLRGTGHFC
jgi:hypothetical protein